MFGIISAAADEGFNIFILLTTDNILLQQQTYDRAIKDLADFCICDENDYILAEDVQDYVYNILLKQVEGKEENFSNGRLVRNIYDDITMNHARRTIKIDKPSRDDLARIICNDCINLCRN